ncbi:MAG: hypothetical protein HY563_01170 [Ignavibacteriales bacterium]|nr:hypothetical protein [Ignavibacteriales bacterium]
MNTLTLIGTLIIPIGLFPFLNAQTWEIGNTKVRVVAEREGEQYRERFFAKSGEDWTSILTSGGAVRPDPALRINERDALTGFIRARVEKTAGEERLILEADAETGTILKTIRIVGDDPFVHVSVICEFRDSVRLQHLLSTYSFLPGANPDFVFTPQLRPEPDDVIGDHTFRAPALMLQKGSHFAALIPDLRTIDGTGRPARAGADLRLDVSPLPMFSFGLLPWAKKNHVYYSHTDSTIAVMEKGSRVEYGFFVYVTATGVPGFEYQNIVRFHWREYGRQNFLQARGPQSESFASYKQKAWKEFVPLVALETEYLGKRVTLLRQERLAWSNKLPPAANNDNWFNVWFNSLRTAYGMYLHAKETGDRWLQEQALGNLNLALAAPDHNGISPSIFYVDSSGGHWVADHGWGGIRDGTCYAMFHNAWTSYWLLRWSDLLPERRNEILVRTRKFADFLVRNQLSSGVVPSWYDPKTLEPVPEFREENAETAGAAFFLVEMYRRTQDRRYLERAERAMTYIATSIVPERKWFDFETFFSCSRKPLGFFDHTTGQHPQNTLSMHQAVEACFSLFELTGKEEYKILGVRILDYLCLYQQIWSPRWLSCELMGGFGVQNTDGEWSDSRQGYFAVTLIRASEIAGSREYFERGVAALRAMFSLFESSESPRTAENYAHAAADRLAGVTGLHWGTGSSVVSIHLIEQTYGDAFVHVGGQWGVGIDGCRIPQVSVYESTINVDLRDNVNTPRKIRVTFGHLQHPKYAVKVNGKDLGTFSAETLKKGIHVSISQ